MNTLFGALGLLAYGARGWVRKAGLVAVLVAGVGGTAAAQNQITIAALGDSLTQGYGLPQDDGFVPQLEAWLRAQGADVRLVNAGVSGDTTAGGLSRVAWTLGGGTDAMIVALGGNDLLRGIDPAASRANLDGILKEAQTRGVPVLLSGMVAPGNYGPEYKREFDAIYPDLAEHYGAIYHPFFLQGLDAGEDAAAARALMQPDGVHPSAEGVARIVEDIGPLVLELIDRAASG